MALNWNESRGQVGDLGIRRYFLCATEILPAQVISSSTKRATHVVRQMPLWSESQPARWCWGDQHDNFVERKTIRPVVVEEHQR